jgi:Cys-tRNA(Pro)/Cys-tRNA(Cys) deacylase
MSMATRATKALERAGLAFTIHRYAYDPGAERIGLQAAQALDETPARVLKTLMARVDGKPALAILPSDAEVSMKKLAAALGGKAAEMMQPDDAERITGYKVGGISPFGQKRVLPVVIEEQSVAHELVYLNAGQRGLQLRLAPRSAVALLKAIIAPIIA